MSPKKLNPFGAHEDPWVIQFFKVGQPRPGLPHKRQKSSEKDSRSTVSTRFPGHRLMLARSSSIQFSTVCCSFPPKCPAYAAHLYRGTKNREELDLGPEHRLFGRSLRLWSTRGVHMRAQMRTRSLIIMLPSCDRSQCRDQSGAGHPVERTCFSDPAEQRQSAQQSLPVPVRVQVCMCSRIS
ncbi:hypothetical protein ZHAS_00015289 [Anopheles sinensis]|uniref:Uncharacterized protein n=1 Tax=Anopheles sinensis TaxID=74873 RepID=A0A084WAL8_ANOSI|nr:hypothetical protein ZHAS_00015289 [Anopheles sinensis]